MIRSCIRWLKSRKIRATVQMRHQVCKHLNAQRDILSAKAVQALEESIRRSGKAIRHGAIPGETQIALKDLETTANQWLRPYPNPGLRDNVEVFLVVAVALMGFRSFFFQPMAIPTGSAQPTFYGIVGENLQDNPDAVIPSGFKKWYRSWIHGESYYHVIAKNKGVFKIIDSEPDPVFPFVYKQRFFIGDRKYTVWFPPKHVSREANLWHYAGLRSHFPSSRKHFEKGETIIKIKVTSGDRLFVNRLIYNFRRPRRGETIVFKSTGLEGQGLTANTHYIKRLVALGGETVSIGDDRRIRINGQPLDASDSGFEFVYGFNPNNPPQKDAYSGHVNGTVEKRWRNWDRSRHSRRSYSWKEMLQHFEMEGPHECPRFDGKSLTANLAPKFRNADEKFQVRENHYLTFGDNTLNSRDSRYWGDIPREKVIGKSGFVFWPISERFGWHAR